MNLLLDTHILLWWLGDPERLSPPAVESISEPMNVCFVSAVTVWEIQINREIGKLKIPESFVTEISRQGFRELPVRWNHTLALSSLPPIHRDPFDRLLVAQAVTDDLTLVSTDQYIKQYDVRTLW